jgi:hypothetical protein
LAQQASMHGKSKEELAKEKQREADKAAKANELLQRKEVAERQSPFAAGLLLTACSIHSDATESAIRGESPLRHAQIANVLSRSIQNPSSASTSRYTKLRVDSCTVPTRLPGRALREGQTLQVQPRPERQPQSGKDRRLLGRAEGQGDR